MQPARETANGVASISARPVPTGFRGRATELFRRAANLLEWSPAGRCLVIALISFVFALFYYFVARGLSTRPDLAQVFNPRALTFGTAALPWIALGWLVVAAVAAMLRTRAPNHQGIVYATLLYYSLPNAVLSYMLGAVTSPLVGIAYTGGTVFALILFDAKPVLVSAGATLLVLIAATVAERAGLIPYAPLFAADSAAGQRPPDWWVAFFGGVSALTAVSLIVAFAYVVQLWRSDNARLEALTRTDALTKLTNRRHFFEIMERECARAERTGQMVSLLMCDADHFKQVNDTHGHQAGDEVLRGIARVLSKSVRTATDTAARLGGEEFAVLLADSNLEKAQVVADRLVEAVRKLEFAHNGSRFGVTISVGAMSLQGERLDPEMLLEAADALLYRAKNEGRDRVVAGTLEHLQSGQT